MTEKERTVFDNDARAGDTAGQQFVEGMPVFDAGDEKIGTVGAYNAQSRYLIVHKGWLFPRDVDVPLQVVARSDADGVYLNLYKDEVMNEDWNAPPVHDLTAGSPSASAVDATTQRRDDLSTDAVEQDARAGAGAGDVRVPRAAEEVVANKQELEIGRVHLHKDVLAEQQTATAPVAHERVSVERVPVQDTYGDIGPDTFAEKDIDIPVMGEELVAGKRAVVTEEVWLRKQEVTEEQQVTETVRRERVTVEGADEAHGADADRIDSVYMGNEYERQ